MRMASELADAIGSAGMVGGQAMDIINAGKKKGGHGLNLINDLKTARLFEVSARLGAIAAGAAAKKIDAMARYGLYFGRAFQIADDIVDNGDYVKTFGVDKAKRDLRRLSEEAKRTLAAFGGKADELGRISDSI